jgi:lysozyme family protein
VSPAFLSAFQQLLKHEGGFTDDPKDRGNWTTGRIGEGVLRGTNYGISAMAYPDEDIRGLTPARARELYHRDYWQRVRGDELPPAVAVVVFDAAVNSGVGRAIIWLQECVRTTADGRLGPVTLAAVTRAEPTALAVEYTRRRVLFLTRIPTFNRFGTGWTQRALEVLVTGVRA